MRVSRTKPLLERPDPAAFTVIRTQVDYRKAAKVDDMLRVGTRYVGVKGVRIHFEQTVWRGAEVIAEARITAVQIHTDGRPRRPIPEIGILLEPYLCKPT